MQWIALSKFNSYADKQKLIKYIRYKCERIILNGSTIMIDTTSSSLNTAEIAAISAGFSAKYIKVQGEKSPLAYK